MRLKVTERFVQSTGGQRKLRYYTSVDHDGHLTAAALTDALSDCTGLSPREVRRLLYHLEDILATAARDGQIVEVPCLGLFKLTVRAATADNPRDAGPGAVKSTRLNFLPCPRLLKDLGI